jgi:hypothetical protein
MTQRDQNPTACDTPRGGPQRDASDRQADVSRDGNEQSTRVRDDGRRDTDLDDDRTDQRMAAQRDAERQAAQATERDGEQIDQGSHAREGMGPARQTDGN